MNIFPKLKLSLRSRLNLVNSPECVHVFNIGKLLTLDSFRRPENEVAQGPFPAILENYKKSFSLTMRFHRIIVTIVEWSIQKLNETRYAVFENEKKNYFL